MKIVAYKEFLELPAGTLYSEIELNSSGDEEPIAYGITLKCDTIYNGDESKPIDFFWEYLLPVDSSTNRDGMFDYNNKYIVYDNNDIDALIQKLESLKNK